MSDVNLKAFIRQSNLIEGIQRKVLGREVAAHVELLQQTEMSVEALEKFVASVAGAELRRHPGMNVRVGRHIPPPGGPRVEDALRLLVTGVLHDAWSLHNHYETLHPFMDGNGRSGRALWLWRMGGLRALAALPPGGFLHAYYYQTLQNTGTRHD